MKRELQQALSTFGIEFIKALPIPSFLQKFLIRHIIGATPLQAHILIERAKMTRKLWLEVMWKDSWRCYLCHEGRRENDPFEAEHKIPLFRFGYTTMENLGCAHKSCNRRKGIKLLEDQILYPTLNVSKNIVIILFLTAVLLSWIIWQMLIK